MAYLFRDTFTGTAESLATHTPDVSATGYGYGAPYYGTGANGWVDGSGKLTFDAGVTVSGALMAAPVTDGYVIEMQFRVVNPLAGGEISLRLALSADVGGGVGPETVTQELSASESGGWSAYGDVGSAAFTPTGAMQTLRLEVSPSVTVLKLDGVTVWSGGTSSVWGQAFDVCRIFLSTTNTEADEISVSDFDGGPFWWRYVKTTEVDS